MLNDLFASLSYWIYIAITLVIAITIHEFAHAYVADQLGDPTPRAQGRVTLNPMSHLDPLGSLMFILFGFGWGRPVLTNPYNFRTSVRTGMAIVAVAGPLSNLVLAIIAAMPLKFHWLDPFYYRSLNDIAGVAIFREFLIVFVITNIALLLLNMLPLSPLDGFKVAMGLLPDDWANKLAQTEQYGIMILMVLLFAGRYGFNPIASTQSTIFGWLVG